MQVDISRTMAQTNFYFVIKKYCFVLLFLISYQFSTRQISNELILLHIFNKSIHHVSYKHAIPPILPPKYNFTNIYENVPPFFKIVILSFFLSFGKQQIWTNFFKNILIPRLRVFYRRNWNISIWFYFWSKFFISYIWKLDFIVSLYVVSVCAGSVIDIGTKIRIAYVYILA